jgi:hypothetical protein
MQKKLPKKKYFVFISHSSKDTFIAKQLDKLIREKCRRHNVKTFLDERDIKGGDQISDTIKSNIKACDELLVLISRYSVDSSWVLLEIGAAWMGNKRIVPIVDKVTPEEMPAIIVQHKAIDLNEFEKYLDEIVERAKRV